MQRDLGRMEFGLSHSRKQEAFGQRLRMRLPTRQANEPTATPWGMLEEDDGPLGSWQLQKELYTWTMECRHY